jgi:two-component system, cell cycle sensor histidine kinase and response regulator CckA
MAVRFSRSPDVWIPGILAGIGIVLGIVPSVPGWVLSLLFGVVGLLTLRIANRSSRSDGERERSAQLELDDRIRQIVDQNAMLSRELLESRQIEETQQFQVRAFDAMFQGICICDPHRPGLPILYVNGGFTRMTGYSAIEAAGRPALFLEGKETSPDAIQKITAAVRARETCCVEILNYRKDGSPFWNALSLSPVYEDGQLVHFVGVQTDITPFKDMETQLRQSQKMEAIGHLAGGVAHDFNNLLTVINGCSEILKVNARLNAEDLELVEEIHAAGDKATNLTRQLLAFSRKTFLQPKILSTNELIADFQKMLVRIIGEDIELIAELNATYDVVRVDPGQIEQVIMNLASNARDAMPQGGRLTIETSDAWIDAKQSRRLQDLPPGQYTRIAVRDTGCGMDDKTLARVFEPFFTTKPVGKGTGLGLAMVYGIVQASGGHVAVESAVGSGTSFVIHLPVVDDTIRMDVPSSMFPSARVGTERILLVEDEASVRSLARNFLQGKGYQVLVACDPEEAIRKAAECDGRIDLLVTDVVMPRGSGRELSEHLTRLSPELRTLFISGYTDDAVVRHGVLVSETDFLQKPFSMRSLTRKVREILDRTPAGLA